MKSHEIPPNRIEFMVKPAMFSPLPDVSGSASRPGDSPRSGEAGSDPEIPGRECVNVVFGWNFMGISWEFHGNRLQLSGNDLEINGTICFVLFMEMILWELTIKECGVCTDPQFIKPTPPRNHA